MTSDVEKSEDVLRTMHVKVGGMRCINCPEMVEARLKLVPGVVAAEVDYARASAAITYDGEIDIARSNEVLKPDGYSLKPIAAEAAGQTKPRFRSFLEIGGVFAVLLGLAFILNHFQLLPRGLSVSDDMSYALVFLIGLVASVSSCLAVTGGLLVALAARYNEANPYFTAWQRLTPHIYFNAGRIMSYTVLGGAIGALGAALTLPPAVSGALTLVASLIMIALGLNMLGLFPPVQHLLPRLPHGLSARLRNAQSAETGSAAFLLGGATFFLPCGFTQSLQLYVLSKADITIGALTMLAFALGTLPALLSLAAVSSLAKGSFQQHFLRFAGAGVILLGLFNIQYGLVLTGSGVQPGLTSTAGVTTAPIVDGVQRIDMRVVGLTYKPSQFTVTQDVPVEWRIDASEAEGCGRMLLARGLQIRKLLGEGNTIIRFTPDRTGEFAFNCGMGMMTPGAKITVIPNKES